MLRIAALIAVAASGFAFTPTLLPEDESEASESKPASPLHGGDAGLSAYDGGVKPQPGIMPEPGATQGSSDPSALGGDGGMATPLLGDSGLNGR